MTDHTDSAPNNADEAPVRSDADLVLRSRSGDADAFAELWRRHYASGMAVARSITSTFDADDLVQEAFARIYQALQKGGGPTGSFRAYLFTSIRNTAAGWGRARREASMDELDTIADPSSTEEAANHALDQSLSAQAFHSLPSRWQEVLWYSEIEQMKTAEIAPLLGMTPGATAQLAFRAREGLREAWIQAHLRTAEPGSICEWTIERLGAYSRGNLGSRDRNKLENHLGECARCLIVAAEAKEVSRRLALVLLPLVLGVGGSSAYAAMLQSGTTPVIALAAMPSSVVEGAVVVGYGPVATGAAGTGTGTTGSGGHSSSSGFIAGFGVLVGAGSIALVVASAIVAAAVVPGLTADPTSTSAPSAADKGDYSVAESSIVAQVSPPAKVPAPAPAAPPAPAPVPAPRQDPPAQPPVTTTPAQAPLIAPRLPAANLAPVAPPAISTPTPPLTDPGTGPADPGPGPGSVVPPAIPPVLGAVAMDCSIGLNGRQVSVTVPLSGVAGATVQAMIGTDQGTAQTVTLDPSGAGLLVLHPRPGHVNHGAVVTFAYVLGTQVGGSTTLSLDSLGSAHWWQCLLGTLTPPTDTVPPAGTTSPGGTTTVPPVTLPADTTTTTGTAPTGTTPTGTTTTGTTTTGTTTAVVTDPATTGGSVLTAPATTTTAVVTDPLSSTAPTTTSAPADATITSGSTAPAAPAPAPAPAPTTSTAVPPAPGA